VPEPLLALSPLGALPEADPDIEPEAEPEAEGDDPLAEELLLAGGVVELIGGGVVAEPVPEEDELVAPGPVERGLSSPQPANAAATADAAATFANKRNVSFIEAPFGKEQRKERRPQGSCRPHRPSRKPKQSTCRGMPGGWKHGFVKDAG
jgi:hypothetical protein